jgi:hypothetical protein
MAEKPPTIFINPKFKNAHINPNFLKSSNSIHINPKFLLAQQQLAPATLNNPPLPVSKPIPASNAIIRNTRRTLIRASAPSRPNVSTTQFSQPFVQRPTMLQQPQLIKISKTKLVTAAHLMKCQQKENEIIKKTTESLIKSKKLQRKSEMPSSIYKLDRRQEPLPKKKRTIVSTYSLRRVDAISPQKVVVSDRKLLKM